MQGRIEEHSKNCSRTPFSINPSANTECSSTKQLHSISKMTINDMFTIQKYETTPHSVNNHNFL